MHIINVYAVLVSGVIMSSANVSTDYDEKRIQLRPETHGCITRTVPKAIWRSTTIVFDAAASEKSLVETSPCHNSLTHPAGQTPMHMLTTKPGSPTSASHAALPMHGGCG